MMKTKVLPTIGDEIVVNELGSELRGYVTGFGRKDGQKTIEYQPGIRPPAGALGSKWCYFGNVVQVLSRKMQMDAQNELIGRYLTSRGVVGFRFSGGRSGATGPEISIEGCSPEMSQKLQDTTFFFGY